MEKVEKIAVLDNEIQAQLVDAVLTDRGIPHVMRSYHDSAYDGLFQGPGAWGHVEAPAHTRGEVLAVIAEIKHRSRSDGSNLESTETVAQVAGEFRKPKGHILDFYSFTDDALC